ncbi:hypothetical protein B0T11DRAFT_88285 [Plectosphaerella cucumerina]|uniref:Uncharacterized protein n=1 Tax=Plectosphaerella cucumerina TaxID=40658 RepID=A0A8K0X5J0_9PEZI|nr:hypothetical protein B0T11DRAFT_88285 [Plectosphaerella cucumerina]
MHWVAGLLLPRPAFRRRGRDDQAARTLRKLPLPTASAPQSSPLFSLPFLPPGSLPPAPPKVLACRAHEPQPLQFRTLGPQHPLRPLPQSDPQSRGPRASAMRLWSPRPSKRTSTEPRSREMLPTWAPALVFASLSLSLFSSSRNQLTPAPAVQTEPNKPRPNSTVDLSLIFCLQSTSAALTYKYTPCLPPHPPHAGSHPATLPHPLVLDPISPPPSVSSLHWPGIRSRQRGGTAPSPAPPSLGAASSPV